MCEGVLVWLRCWEWDSGKKEGNGSIEIIVCWGGALGVVGLVDLGRGMLDWPR
jgi:hypothetical protein